MLVHMRTQHVFLREVQFAVVTGERDFQIVVYPDMSLEVLTIGIDLKAGGTAGIKIAIITLLTCVLWVCLRYLVFINAKPKEHL